MEGYTVLHEEPKDYMGAPSSAGTFLGGSGYNEAWTHCVKALREYDQHMIQGWKEDVDSLLVFAGLFSAAVTAFNVEAYKLLQEDPEEKTAALLDQIYTHLTSNNSGSVDRVPTLDHPFHPDARAVRINTLWFSSLVVSLVSASIGILTKQWLREYAAGAASSPRENARIRQLRHDDFIAWKIPLTIALLPIFLQIALALFFAGLLDLLWSLHASVAGVITAIVTLSLSFFVITTIMPTFRDDCPYKSPQALGLYFVTQIMIRALSLAAMKVYGWLHWDRAEWPLQIQPALFYRSKRVIAKVLSDLIHKRFFSSWREREMAIIRREDSSPQLDRRVLADADATIMEDDFLFETIRFCLADVEWSVAAVSLDEIITHRADVILDGVPQWRHRETMDSGVSFLLHLVLDVLPRIDCTEHARIERFLTYASNMCRAISFKNVDAVPLYQRLFDVLAALLTYASPVKMGAFRVMQVIQRLLLFARDAKLDNNHHAFYSACEMVLAFSTTDGLPRVALDSVRDELSHMLKELERSLITSQTGDAPDAPGSGRSASILVGLDDLNELHPDLIQSPTLRSFLRSVRGEVVDVESIPRGWDRRLTPYVRQLQEHYERHPQATMGRRRRTTTSRSNALGLESPQSPRHAPIPSESNGSHDPGAHRSSSGNGVPNSGNHNDISSGAS
ncbi:hypothetical protein C8Q79DRAFT_929292 [Trametes meyenii]|nr:hypothetical protein C8Q79DRAFT_929292 [Trametes meyenii]